MENNTSNIIIANNNIQMYNNNNDNSRTTSYSLQNSVVGESFEHRFHLSPCQPIIKTNNLKGL